MSFVRHLHITHYIVGVYVFTQCSYTSCQVTVGMYVIESISLNRGGDAAWWSSSLPTSHSDAINQRGIPINFSPPLLYREGFI